MNPPQQRRIIGLDIARAAAIVGMVIVNFTIGLGAEGNGSAWLSAFTTGLSGRAAAVFVVLAGVGASLGARRAATSGDLAQQRQARNTLWKRAGFLFVAGWLLYPIWPADILHYYGVYLTIGGFAIFASNRTLHTLTTLAVAISALFIVFADPFANWNLSDYSYTNMWTPSGFVRNLFLDGFHPVFPWVGFYVFGMWLGRTDLRSSAWRTRLIATATPVAVLSELAAYLVLGPRGTPRAGITDDSWQQLFATEPLPPLPLYMTAATATAVAVIVTCIQIGLRAPNALTAPLVATGQLALTTYVAHVIIGFGFLETIGRIENQTLPFAVGAALVFSALAVVASWLWRQRFARGPIETLMRRVAG